MRSFLELPARSTKPRQWGLTHLLDNGLNYGEVDELGATASEYIDIVKLGWGTSVVTPNLPEKIERYANHSIPVVLGGTLGEIALAQNRYEELLDWIGTLGLTYVEISDGAVPIPRQTKLKLIERLASQGDLTVLSEVGSKDPDALVAPYRWVKEIREELEAGSQYVILEAREGGNAGVYRPNGEVRMGLVEEIVLDIDPNRLIFEAPLKHQQVWFIDKFGSNVNLGNIKPEDVIGLETLRLGLRSDTVHMLEFDGLEDPPSSGRSFSTRTVVEGS